MSRCGQRRHGLDLTPGPGEGEKRSSKSSTTTAAVCPIAKAVELASSRSVLSPFKASAWDWDQRSRTAYPIPELSLSAVSL